MKKPRSKRRRFAWRSLLFLFLFCALIVSLILKSSIFQTKVSEAITHYFAEKSNCEVEIGKVEFQWYKKLLVNDFLVKDHHGDTLIFSEKIFVKVNDLELETLEFDIEEVEVNDAYLNMIHYEGEEQSNLNRFIGGFKSQKDSTAAKKVIHLGVEEVILKNARFNFDNQNKDVKGFGIDYSHLSATEINGKLLNFQLYGDSMESYLDHFSFGEKSGFDMGDLSALVTVSPSGLELDKMHLTGKETNLQGMLKFKTKNFSDWKQFNSKVRLYAQLEKSTLTGEDLSYFVPSLRGLKDSVVVSGTVKGKVNNLRLRNFETYYGNATHFKGKVDINGLPDIKNAFVYVHADDLQSSDEDISSIPLPPFTSGKRLKTPKWLKNLGRVTFKGNYTGFSNDFVAYGAFKTSCGKVSADVHFTENSGHDLEIKGGVNTSRFSLRRLLSNEKLGSLAFNGDVKAKVIKGNFKINIKGDSPLFDYADYRYGNIRVNGELTREKFDGALSVNDSNLVMAFEGGVNFAKRQKEFKFDAKVDRANLSQLGLLKRDSSTNVKFEMEIDARGNTIEDIQGKLHIHDFIWEELGHQYDFNHTIVKSEKAGDLEFIDVESDWFQARVEGKYNVKELYSSFVNILSRDLPSLTNTKYALAKSKGKNNFNVNFDVKNYELIRDLFSPSFYMSKARFNGHFDDQQQIFFMEFIADSLQIGREHAKKVRLSAHNKDGRVSFYTKSEFIGIKDSIGLRRFNVETHSKNNLTEYIISWNNDRGLKNNAKIKGQLGVERLDSVWTHIKELDLTIHNNKWEMDKLNKMVFKPGEVIFDHFEMHSGQEYIDVEGLLSVNEENKLSVVAQNFQLENLQEMLDRYKVEVEGFLSGYLEIEGKLKQPIVKGDMEVDGFKFNKQSFGQFCINSSYVSEQSKLYLDLYAKNESKTFSFNTIELAGDFFPKTGVIDMDLGLKNMKLTFLEPYFKGVFSDFKAGKSTGNLALRGTLSHPVLEGVIKLDQLNLLVEYLNVNYAVNGQKINFSEDEINFEDFEISHNQYLKSKASVNGVVSHNGFKDFKYDFDSIHLKDFIGLHTTIDDNSSYYGTAFVDGLLEVSGEGSKSNISGTISTVSYEDKFQKGKTSLNLPLSEVGELEVSDFVRFVDLKDSTAREEESDSHVDLSGLSLDFNFLIHDEATAKIIFDPQVGDEITVNGEGNVNMKINSEGRFEMTGLYEIEKGHYNFTLKNFIGKKFTVQKGGTIQWDGDPLNANINLKTYYTARPKLVDLADPLDANYENIEQQFSNRTPVNAGLNLQGPLLTPEIKMEVDMPNGSLAEQEFLQTHIVGEDEVNRQVFSLLLTNQFLPSSAGGLGETVSIGTGIDNGIQFVEGQLNNALGSVFKNVNVGVDYNSASGGNNPSGSTGVDGEEQLNEDELRLLLGFQYKKFSVQSDYDLNNEAGEIQIEFRLTDQLKAKAYSKRLAQAIVLNGSQITNGAGLVFQKSFDNFGDLFKRDASFK